MFIYCWENKHAYFTRVIQYIRVRVARTCGGLWAHRVGVVKGLSTFKKKKAYLKIFPKKDKNTKENTWQEKSYMLYY